MRPNLYVRVTTADAYFCRAAAIIKNSEKGSNARLSNIDASSATRSPLNINPKMRRLPGVRAKLQQSVVKIDFILLLE
jgi:hypothetical protein